MGLCFCKQSNSLKKMGDSTKKVKVSKKQKAELDRDLLEKMTREELIDKIIKLDAHNQQLKNIIQRKNKDRINEQEVAVKKKIDFNVVSKRHVLLKFFYLGWDSQGFVSQEDTINTIEHYLFHALKKCCLIEKRENSNYHRCGRTDKGVSAFSQVISIDLRSKVPKVPSEKNVEQEFLYCSMLNRILPEHIRCYAWAHVGSNVSSRFDCTSRTYKYYFPRGNLNLEDMLEGAKFLVGAHDFRNLCKMDVGNGVVNFEREISNVDIRKCFSTTEEKSEYQMFEFVIQAKSFLWHQIRCIMSVLLLIGQGKESPDVIKHLLNTEENPNKPQYSLASHIPLNLYSVDYESIPIQWNVNQQDLSKTIELLQSLWTKNSVKNAMIRDMLEDLKKLSKDPVNLDKVVEPLLDGVKAKVYRPLLSRMTCEGLENKINHYVKKRKLEVIETTCESCKL